MAMDNKAASGPFTRYAISRYASEFVGTFVLVASIKLIVASGTPLAAFGIGVTLMSVVSTFGYISLAQFNPSVTIAFVVRDCKELPRKDYIQWTMYIVMQFCGGICGGFFAWMAGGKDACDVYTFVNADYTVSQAFFGELFYCAMIATVNLHVASDERLNGNQVYPAAIGMILTVSVLSIGHISGSAINTAVWAGTVSSASACLDDGETLNLDHCWIYWVAHILAGLISGGWFVLIYGRDMNGVNAKMVDEVQAGSADNRTTTELTSVDQKYDKVHVTHVTEEEEQEIR